MDVPFFDRFKQCQVDLWTTREHLCLASAVTRNGDQNWAAVSRSIRLLTSENERPPDWYSTKNCALQFDKLLEQVDIPKRKREKGEPNLNETPGEILIKMLNKKRIEELEGILEEERATYEKLKREVQLLESDQCDNRLQQFWDEIISEQEKEDEEIQKRKVWLKEREERIRVFQSASKLQPLKCIGLSSPHEYQQDKDSEKSNFVKQRCLSENSSSDDSDASKTNTRAKEKQNPSDKSEKETIYSGITKESSESDAIVTSSVVLNSNDDLVSTTVKSVKETSLENNCASEHASDLDIEVCQRNEMKQPDGTLLPEIPNYNNSDVMEVEKLIPVNHDLNAVEVESKIQDSAINIDTKNKQDTLGPIKKLEQASISGNKVPCFYKSIKLEAKKSTDDNKDLVLTSAVKCEAGEIAVKSQLNEPAVVQEDEDTNKCLKDVKIQDVKVKKSIDIKYEIEETQTNLKNEVKIVSLEKFDNKDCQEKLAKNLEIKSALTQNLDINIEEDNTDDDQLLRRGRKRKMMQASPKEEEKIGTSDIKAKIKLENEMQVFENKLNKFCTEKTELCEAFSSEELHIEKLPHADEKKKTDEEEKKKPVKNEVKDEYEFDDDISRDSTDVKEYYMSRADRRKFALGESVCSPVVSESAPSSPASTSYGDDPESEKQHRTWKRSIMLIWNDIAAHKNASLFLRPITEDKVPGYHSVVFRPIDLLTIKRNVENGMTRTTSDFQHDVMLMLLNAKMYNTKNHNIYRMADEMMRDVLEFIEEFVNTQLLSKVLETPQKNLRRETRESSAKRGGDDKKKDDKEEKLLKRRKLC